MIVRGPVRGGVEPKRVMSAEDDPDPQHELPGSPFSFGPLASAGGLPQTLLPPGFPPVSG